jgi:hypothetical protein
MKTRSFSTKISKQYGQLKLHQAENMSLKLVRFVYKQIDRNFCHKIQAKSKEGTLAGKTASSKKSNITRCIDYVRQNEIQGRNMVFFKPHAYSTYFILPDMVHSFEFSHNYSVTRSQNI